MGGSTNGALVASCTLGPIPGPGWQIWRTPNPPPAILSKFAKECLYKPGFALGATWQTTWQDRDVLAIKQIHTWTHRGGKLVTGLCIPGVTLYWRPTGIAPSPTPSDPPTIPALDSPAMFDDPGTDWIAVGFSGAAIVGVCTLFALVLKYGGRR